MPDPKVLEQMRKDWNERAREDANYYVAFGRRDQDDAEFLATAADVVRSLEAELKRLHSRETALEIGCGPGRLLLPMSRHFIEIHGVDVAEEMVRLAAQRLAAAPHAHVHATSGTDLGLFAAETFDFVYSYAVFQHIPSREVVFQYLIEARRVMKTGGILRCQINGLPPGGLQYGTWEGVRISAGEMAAFAGKQDLQLLALEGASTQYMWITCRKRPDGWTASLQNTGADARASARVRYVTNAHTGEAAVPSSGPYAALSLWLENLPEDCDLNALELRADGRSCQLVYLGPPAKDGICQLSGLLPSGIRTGLVELELNWLGTPLCPTARMRVVPAGPSVPRLVSVTDGVNFLAGTRIASGSLKVQLEEVVTPELFSATINGQPVHSVDILCTDPVTSRYEINLRLPDDLAPGCYQLGLSLGRRTLAPALIEVLAPHVLDPR